jgi:branched-chain amino acid aminotransferase
MLAREEGLTVKEAATASTSGAPMPLRASLLETFACGTAAVVTPVGKVADHNGEFVIGTGGPGQLTQKLRQRLVAIQRGDEADTHGWVTRIA